MDATGMAQSILRHGLGRFLEKRSRLRPPVWNGRGGRQAQGEFNGQRRDLGPLSLTFLMFFAIICAVSHAVRAFVLGNPKMRLAT